METGQNFRISMVAKGGSGIWSSITADRTGKLHLSFSNPQNEGGLGYAVWDNEKWFTETVDKGPEIGEYNSISLLPDGRPVICYFDRLYCSCLRCVVREH